MSQKVDYSGIADRRKKDDKAIADIKSYLGKKTWKVLLGESEKVQTGNDFQQINIGMFFAGISGFPVHAFGRRYCLVGYREWMATPNNDGPGIATDEHGYRIEEEAE
jgi:hypothetical protein